MENSVQKVLENVKKTLKRVWEASIGERSAGEASIHPTAPYTTNNSTENAKRFDGMGERETSFNVVQNENSWILPVIFVPFGVMMLCLVMENWQRIALLVLGSAFFVLSMDLVRVHTKIKIYEQLEKKRCKKGL